jgi:hypothetical protein
MSGKYSTEDRFYIVFGGCDKRYTPGLEKLSDSLVAAPPQTDMSERNLLATRMAAALSLGVSQVKQSVSQRDDA